MVVKTERLEIRPFSDADRSAAVALLTDSKIKETYMIPDFESEDEAVKLFERLKTLSHTADRYVAGIYFENALIGFVNDVELNGAEIELGYVIAPQYQNRGFATEMLKAVAKDLFVNGFTAVVAGAFETNGASIRVMIKSGMTQLDKQDMIEYRGKTHRCVYYAIRNEG